MTWENNPLLKIENVFSKGFSFIRKKFISAIETLSFNKPTTEYNYKPHELVETPNSWKTWKKV